MYQLFSKDESTNKSTLYISFQILKLLKREKSTIFEVVDRLKRNNINSSKEIIVSLSLLFSMGIIEFKEPYICTTK